MRPDHFVYLGALLLLLGAFNGLVFAFGLPPRLRARLGYWQLLPQIFATLGAAAAVWGFYQSRNLLRAWHDEDVRPAADMIKSLDRVIALKSSLGIFIPVMLFACLLCAALPVWRSSPRER